MTFDEEACGLYRKRPHHILPYVGAAFRGGHSDLLRVALVGINSHISAKDWDPAQNFPRPEWFGTWFEKDTHRHNKRIRAEATQLLVGLAQRPGPFAGRPFRWPESCYSTNAIKIHLPDEAGKRADQVVSGVFDEHLSTWRAELDLAAKYGVLPHIVIVFGRPFWSRACDSLRPQSASAYRHFQVTEYHHSAGATLHFVNRVVLRDKNEMLFVRLRHPASRTQVGSAHWLLAQPGFNDLLEQAVP